jgi:hypothetical protein
MNIDKRDLNGFKRFVLGFYLKISVHLRLSVVEKEFSNSLLRLIGTMDSSDFSSNIHQDFTSSVYTFR